MDPFDVINEFYPPNTDLYAILVRHSELVAEKALKIAKHVPALKPDLDFIYQAAMLHDIAIFQTNAVQIGCQGPHPYVMHGILGREILEQKRMPRHALVCERHVGAGISAEEIKSRKLPIPTRDMIPESIEEIIICFADKFFSKDLTVIKVEKPFSTVMKTLARYGQSQTDRFLEWKSLLNYS